MTTDLTVVSAVMLSVKMIFNEEEHVIDDQLNFSLRRWLFNVYRTVY